MKVASIILAILPTECRLVYKIRVLALYWCEKGPLLFQVDLVYTGYQDRFWEVKVGSVILITSPIEHKLAYTNMGASTICTIR